MQPCKGYEGAFLDALKKELADMRADLYVQLHTAAPVVPFDFGMAEWLNANDPMAPWDFINDMFQDTLEAL